MGGITGLTQDVSFNVKFSKLCRPVLRGDDTQKEQIPLSILVAESLLKTAASIGDVGIMKSFDEMYKIMA